MSKMVWDAIGERLFETGVSQGAIYPQAAGAYPAGVPWNGLVSVAQTPSGGEPTPFYANNRKYLNLYSVEELGGTIEAFTYPDEFAECNGSAVFAQGVRINQQTRKAFGMAYKSVLGNDTEGIKHGYKLHLIYGMMVSPSEKTHSTINENVEPTTMSWEYSTTPVDVAGFEPTSSLEITSTDCDAEKLAELEAILYGSEDAEPRLPLPDEVATILGEVAAG